MIKLTNRLQTIANLVRQDDKVLDIGCDHGLLDIYLSQNNIKVIASDINPNALNQMKANLIKYSNQGNGPVDAINIRLGSGLKPVKSGEVDTIILAGMGTETILKILEDDKEKLTKINKIITQSNRDQEELRKGIRRYGYYIKEEKVVLEKGHYYTIILFQKGFRFYRKKDYYLGPILRKNGTGEYEKMLRFWFQTNEKIISQMTEESNKKPLIKRQKWIKKAIKKDM